MSFEPPSWWYAPPGWQAASLTPLGWLYGGAVRLRFWATKPYRASIPVICIGNFTMGGAGKTPLAIHLARLIKRRGLKPAFLTRGYGGSLDGPVKVESNQHLASEVGDEALLLARHAPTIVARQKPAGALLIESEGADVIIMDDGFQNPTLEKNFSIIAVDAAAGIGNGRVFPAGPLRAPLAFQIARAGAIVSSGLVAGAGCEPAAIKASADLPFLRARIRPSSEPGWLNEAPVIAFCGIGRPEKFFSTLRELGAEPVRTVPFPDHYVFTEADAAALLKQADNLSAQLVTTEKDWIRLPPGDGPLGALREKARALLIELEFAPGDEARLEDLLDKILSGSPPRPTRSLRTSPPSPARGGRTRRISHLP